LNVNTTQRVTTTVKLFRPGGPLYAGWLPLSGLALLGVGVGGKLSRKATLAARFGSGRILDPDAFAGGLRQFDHHDHNPRGRQPELIR
jgi:hypothetical protein